MIDDDLQEVLILTKKSILILSPDSLFRSLVDFISFMLIMGISLYIPFIFAFDIDTTSGNI
jgi:hypothetical protein